MVALAATQLNQQDTDVPYRVQNNDDEDVRDDELVDPLNRRCANNGASTSHNQQAQGKRHQ